MGGLWGFMRGLVVCTAVLTGFEASATPLFIGLGDLPGGEFNSAARAISADGSVVVGRAKSDAGSEAVRWAADTGLVGLGELPGGAFFATGSGVSADGSVVVGASDGALGREAFVWTVQGGMVGLGDLPGGTGHSEATGVSDDGQVSVGYSGSPLGFEAFRWDNATGLAGLGDLPGATFFSISEAVSGDGNTIVGFGESSGLEAFRWTATEGMLGLGSLPGGRDSRAFSASFDGSVIVGFAESSIGEQAFRWDADSGMLGLGDLSGGLSFSQGRDVSADGSLVVGRGESAAGSEAVLWGDDGARSLRLLLEDQFGLDLSGWTLTSAEGISADGRTIVGFGTNPSGNTEAWLARIPEPSSFPLLCFSLLGIRLLRASTLRQSVRKAVVPLVLGLALAAHPHLAQALPVTVPDFPSASTVIDFDDFPHSSLLSGEFSALGVLFESGEPSGPESGSTNPNDFLQPGESVSPLVQATLSVPSLGTSSPPNKVIGTKIGAGGETLGCESCNIIITFLNPIPTIAGLYITDADFKNNASFFGPTGLLDVLVLGPGTGPPAFVGFEDPGGISQIVIKSSIPGGGGSGGIGIDDVRFGAPVPQPSSSLLLGLGLAALAVLRHRTTRN